MSGIGNTGPSEIVNFLLANFESDDDLASALYVNFISGSWWENESACLNGKIAQLDAWIRNRELPVGVKSWVRSAIGYLNQRLEVVLVGEAEEG